ncbi:DUF2272 domain-containing protein [Caldovatus sediminis]|nr:DUF2272 domain-containing protein [Caldovatus sediminis]
MLRIAVSEWIEWGRQRADAAAPDEAGKETAGDGAAMRSAESAPLHFPRLVAYWRAVPEDEGAVARNRERYRAALAAERGLLLPAGGAAAPPRSDPSRPWAEPPWSAAFISFVMRTAGVDRREFPPAAAHATYIDALIADAEAFPALAPFLPHAPEAYAPRPGDLVCADRSPSPLRHWRDRAGDQGRFRPMHCDIVVGAAPGAVEAIGGNVRDAVTLTRFPTDARGVLLPRPPGAPVWFAVFENRLGRLPPWGPDRPAAVAGHDRPAAPLPTGSPAS